MTHFLEPQFVIALALTKLNQTYISTDDLNQFRIDLEKKISDLDYLVLCSDYHINQLMISFSDFFEKRDEIILTKVDLDRIVRTFVVYLPNVLWLCSTIILIKHFISSNVLKRMFQNKILKGLAIPATPSFVCTQSVRTTF